MLFVFCGAKFFSFSFILAALFLFVAVTAAAVSKRSLFANTNRLSTRTRDGLADLGGKSGDRQNVSKELWKMLTRCPVSWTPVEGPEQVAKMCGKQSIFSNDGLWVSCKGGPDELCCSAPAGWSYFNDGIRGGEIGPCPTCQAFKGYLIK